MAQRIAAALIEESREAIMSGPDEEAKEEFMRMFSQGVAWTEKLKKRREKQRAYYQANKEAILAQKADYYIRNRPIIIDKVAAFKAMHPEYIKTEARKFYYNHQDEINEWQKTKQTCECGGKYTNVNKSTHEKSQKHINFLELV